MSLRPYVECLWVSTGPKQPVNERTLPTGLAHLVIRLDRAPAVVFDGARRHNLEFASFGGARDRAYWKTGLTSECVIGVQFRPGASLAFADTPAHKLANTHTPAAQVFGARTLRGLLARLERKANNEGRLDEMEAFLAARLRPLRESELSVAMAPVQLEQGTSIANVVENSGLSHRYFNRQFEALCGLTPKRYQRVRRFDRAIALAHAHNQLTLTDVAFEAGYADQAHLCREFKAIGGITASQFRLAADASPHHISG